MNADDLLRRLDEIGASLARRQDAVALLGLGSVGRDTHRLDEHSDLDFFAIVEEGAKQRYLDAIDWLSDAHPVAYSFRNTVDGRKALFADGIFAEYAVFAVAELPRIPFAPGRLVWARAGAPAGLELPAQPHAPAPVSLEFELNEALTNLYVGLQRDARGERLSGMRLIQVLAVDRVLGVAELLEPDAPPRQDDFAVERGAETRFPALPLAAMTPGSERNREAALAILAWLEARCELDAALAAAIRALASPASA